MLMFRVTAYLVASVAGTWGAWHLARVRYRSWKLLSVLGVFILPVVFGDKVLPHPWNLKYEDFTRHGIVAGAGLAFAIPLAGILAAGFLSTRALRLAVLGLMSIAFFKVVWLKPLDSMTAMRELSTLHTEFDKNGVCRQTTGYTCGPAAAVTALRRIGVNVEERDIAANAETGLFFGTDEFMLAHAMNHSSIPDGPQWNVKDFHNVEEMNNLSPLLVVEHLYGDNYHYIVVLGIKDGWIIYADPLPGSVNRMPRAAFEKDWTMRGIVRMRNMAS